MYPTALTQLARGNPFSAPLFSLQKAEEPQQRLPKRGARKLAAAATSDGNASGPGRSRATLAPPAGLARWRVVVVVVVVKVESLRVSGQV